MTSDPNEQQDALDMARLVAGHDAALNDLMARHSEKVFHYLIRQLQNETEAEELAQETFVRVYQNRARYNPRARFSTWLYTIATNLVRDRWRWRRRHPQVSLDAEDENSGAALQDKLPESQPGPGEKMVAEERANSVRRAVAKLPEDLRTVLLLVEYEGQSHAEIGALLGCSVKAVESRLFRARQQLRARLQQEFAQEASSLLE
jgi:RNA polymerase sigma-70 factor (ECF subfamily)